MTPSQLFNLNVFLLQTRLLSLQDYKFALLDRHQLARQLQLLSLFVALDQTFKLQLLHATTFVLSDYNFYNVRFCFQLSTTHASIFPFRSTFGALDFPFGYLSLETFLLSLLILHLSRDSLLVRLIQLHIYSSNDFFLISCLFLLQFNSAVTKIQTSRSMFQRLP